MNPKSLATVLGAIVLFQTGWIVGQLAPADAYAQDMPSIPEVEPFYDPPRLYCRTFTVPLKGAGTAFETSDTTTEIGKWIHKEEASYEFFSMDFEVSPKATGYPQGYAQVCLSPRPMGSP